MVILGIAGILAGHMQMAIVEAAGVPVTLGLAQTRRMALSNSEDYRKVKSRIVLQSIKYQEAQKAIALKKKNMSTFRWTPLLSFKFPEKAKLVDEAEYIYKPLQIQSEMSALQHRLTDLRYQTYETVSNLYVELYTGQESIFFYERRMEQLKDTLRRNQARLLLGEAYQSDLDSMEKEIAALENTLATQMRALENNKEKLSELIGMDITTGYQFSNPYAETAIGRQHLEEIIAYTLANDQELYEAKLDSAAKLTAMNSNESLMRNQYGDKMNRIDHYMNQARRGEKIDTGAFRSQYDALINDVDRPWQGNYRILFIRFPKEWLKGQIDGVRYIEDEPYMLYTNALEYQEALQTQRQTEKTIRQSVKEGFEVLVTARNSYLAMQSQVEQLKEQVTRSTNLNLVGELSYEELAGLQKELEEASMEALEALATYSQLLYSYDRTTCGAITLLLQEEDIAMGEIAGGESFIIEETVEGASYYIHTKIEDQVFDFGIYIPQAYEISLTAYELWCQDIRIGERTPIDQQIRHLLLDLKGTEKVFVRFYDGDEFVDDCEIDPQTYSGPLEVVGDYLIQQETQRQLGTFTYQSNVQTQLLTIQLTCNPAMEIAYYRIKTQDGKSLLTEAYLEIEKEFQYLNLMEGDLEQLIVELYDTEQKLVSQAFFDTKTLTLLEEMQ